MISIENASVWVFYIFTKKSMVATFYNMIYTWHIVGSDKQKTIIEKDNLRKSKYTVLNFNINFEI